MAWGNNKADYLPVDFALVIVDTFVGNLFSSAIDSSGVQGLKLHEAVLWRPLSLSFCLWLLTSHFIGPILPHDCVHLPFGHFQRGLFCWLSLRRESSCCFKYAFALKKWWAINVIRDSSFVCFSFKSCKFFVKYFFWNASFSSVGALAIYTHVYKCMIILIGVWY